MKPFAWSAEKNAQLMAERELCFEAVVVAMEAGELLDVLEHPSQARYPDQRHYNNDSSPGESDA